MAAAPPALQHLLCNCALHTKLHTSKYRTHRYHDPSQAEPVLM